jgi:hypothetical protein
MFTDTSINIRDRFDRWKGFIEMLKNIPGILGPELLKVLAEMGHGDEIVIADGNFPIKIRKNSPRINS